MPRLRQLLSRSAPPDPSGVVYTCPPVDLQLADGDEHRWMITRVGTWQGIAGGEVHLTAEVLREVADSYDPDYLRAAINLDHEWGGPSHGWIQSLAFDGNVLWGIPESLSDEVVQLISSRRYERQSAEIKPRFKLADGREVWYLRGVALLGNADPAVPGLDPITVPITLAQDHYLIHLSDGSESSSVSDPEATPGEAAAAEPSTPTDPSPDGEEEDPTMSDTRNQGDQGAAPGAEPQATGQGDAQATATPNLGDSQPTEAQLAAARQEHQAELTALRREREQFAAERREARLERAQARVDRDLEQLSGRVPPCMLRNTGLRELMVHLAAEEAEQQTTVQLAAPAGEGGQETTIERGAYDVLHGALRALPDQLGSLSTELAGDDADPPPATDPRDHKTRQIHLAAGLKDERLEELAGRYGREAIFGPSN